MNIFTGKLNSFSVVYKAIIVSMLISSFFYGNALAEVNKGTVPEDMKPISEMSAGKVPGQVAVPESKPDLNPVSLVEAVPAEGDNAYLSEAGEFSVKNFDPTVWVLIILFNLALAVSIERAWYLYKNRGKNAELVDFLTTGLSANVLNHNSLIEKAKDAVYGIEGRIAAKTLEGWSFGRETMTEFSKAAIGAESRGLDRRLVILSTLGNNTPFIGLLGTVLGIMKAFRDLAMVGDAGPAVVMKGISEALIATAFGLAVAIPCVIAFNAFSKQVKNRLSNAQEIVDILIGIRTAFEKEGPDGIKGISVNYPAKNKNENDSVKTRIQSQTIAEETV